MDDKVVDMGNDHAGPVVERNVQEKTEYTIQLSSVTKAFPPVTYLEFAFQIMGKGQADEIYESVLALNRKFSFNRRASAIQRDFQSRMVS